MSSRIVITDDSTGQEILRELPYYEVMTRPTQTGKIVYYHYSTWELVIEKLKESEGMVEVSIRKQ